MSPYTSNILAIKRRLEGAAGAPVGLSAAELAYNQVDNTLYYGFSSLDTNTVTSIAIAGSGAYVSLEGNQDVYGNKTFNGDVTFNNPVSFRNSDFNFGNFTSYNSLSSVGITTLSATNFAGNNVIVNASTVTTLVSTVPTDDKSNKAASTAFVHGMVDSIASGLSNGIVDVSTNQTIAGNKTFTGLTTLSSVSLGFSKITNLGDPQAAYDAVNKKYVDGIASSLNIHPAVKAATTEALTVNYVPLDAGLSDTLEWNFYGVVSETPSSHLVQAIDNVDIYAGNRLLIKDQVDTVQNGVWEILSIVLNGDHHTVTFIRTLDYNQTVPGEVAAGDFLFVTEGTVNANRGFVQVSTGVAGVITIGTDPITFSQFSGAGQITAGTGLKKEGDTLSLNDVGVADSYLSVTTDGQGRVTSGRNPNSLVGLSGVAMSERQLPLYTGTSSVCAVSLTNFGEALIGNTSYYTASATLGLGDLAFQSSSNVSFTGGTIQGITVVDSYIDAGTF